MRSPVLLAALAFLAGCDTSSSDVTFEDLTLTNAADRPIEASVYSRESLASIDLRDAIRANAFEAGALAVGETVGGPVGYDPGEDLVVIVYARRDEPTPWIEEEYGPGAAELVARLDVSWDDLRESDYRIVVRDAE